MMGTTVLVLVTDHSLKHPPTWQSYGNQRLHGQLEEAPDDGHNSARTRNRRQLEARPTWQSYGNQRLHGQLQGAPDDGHNSARNMLSGVYATKQ
jgi:hypothetical protein